MQDERFTVMLSAADTCFVYLPQDWLRRLASRSTNSRALQVTHKKATYYLSYCETPSESPESLCLGYTFARSLNISEKDDVYLSSVDAAPSLTMLEVSPKSEKDRVVLELQADNVQSRLLNQIRVVARDQPIVAWPARHNHVTLVIKKLVPSFKYGQLEELTEIHVGDVVGEALGTKTTKTSALSPLSMLGSMPAPLRPSQRIYRAQPLPELVTYTAKDAFGEWLRTPFFALVREELLPTGCTGKDCLLRIKKVKEDRQHVNTSKFSKKPDANNGFVVRVRTVEESLDNLKKLCVDKDIENHFACFQSHDGIHLTQDPMNNLRLKIGAKVTLELIGEVDKVAAEETKKCTSIEILPEGSDQSAVAFKNYVATNSKHSKMLLNSQSTMTLGGKSRCLVKLLPESCAYGLFDAGVLERVEIRVSDAADARAFFAREELLRESVEDFSIKGVTDDPLRWITSECGSSLKLSLGLHNVKNFEYDAENVLIGGANGSGKTTICKLLANALSKQPYFVYSRFADCKSLKGKKAEVVQKLLSTEISQAVYHQPSILFLDDVDSVTSPSSNSTDENSPDAINAARTTDAIFNAVTEYQRTSNIVVIATCTDVTKVGKKLREARGVHFFRSILTIPPLEKEGRIKILKSSLGDKLKLAGEIDWEHYGNKTEGWVAQDLVVLADKAAFAAWKRHVKEQSQEPLTLYPEDLESTLSRCSPMSLHGVNLYQGEGHSWSSIGGLADVKRDLVEILDWPLKYPGVFKDSPIKLQSGILLYGMPGTGKTMLAGAIAKECGLNLISVKGPELLSKYIGASEEAVRNVFEKAHRAKPCVLFFDEFDSLAPRRGHDSTGVTDRVVNQLLTHLDGIEGREGVAVVAASSRPDLLDPALLRPGRLDKALLCPIPNELEREEILHLLCKSHGIDCNELDLKYIANATSSFTGADLKAVLMQARLDVIEEAMNSSSVETKEHFAEAKVTQDHLLNAVKLSKPSLLGMEIQKYNRIYEKFARSESSTADELKQQKATLA